METFLRRTISALRLSWRC